MTVHQVFALADRIDDAHQPATDNPQQCANPDCNRQTLPCAARRATAAARRDAVRGWPHDHTALADLTSVRLAGGHHAPC